MERIDLSIVVGYGTNFVIGIDGKIPWWLPADMHWFVTLTKQNGAGSVCIVGRKTYESFPKGLPERVVIILTNNDLYQPNPTNAMTFVCSSWDAIYRLLKREKVCHGKKVFCIGGGDIYTQALSFTPGDNFHVSKIYATVVSAMFAGDTIFTPPAYLGMWKTEILQDHPIDEKNLYPFRIFKYSR